ncbi:hypothetical protein IE53DRAFT_390950 [Violaceomyces palustris]|uniref:Uncharacterized protein n=1 Tax=Violaceomyces palustris TaxID=1673888 RepID=A0ACD0NM38_9BASI|nr:hypothetical protein IE53DRAFT_390950 [Violaceomyces palustris]
MLSPGSTPPPSKPSRRNPRSSKQRDPVLPSSSSLTSLPTRQHRGTASERLAARRASSGSNVTTSNSNRLSPKSPSSSQPFSSTDLLPSPMSPPTSPKLSRSKALSRRQSGNSSSSSSSRPSTASRKDSDQAITSEGSPLVSSSHNDLRGIMPERGSMIAESDSDGPAHILSQSNLDHLHHPVKDTQSISSQGSSLGLAGSDPDAIFGSAKMGLGHPNTPPVTPPESSDDQDSLLASLMEFGSTALPLPLDLDGYVVTSQSEHKTMAKATVGADGHIEAPDEEEEERGKGQETDAEAEEEEDRVEGFPDPSDLFSSVKGLMADLHAAVGNTDDADEGKDSPMIDDHGQDPQALPSTASLLSQRSATSWKKPQFSGEAANETERVDVDGQHQEKGEEEKVVEVPKRFKSHMGRRDTRPSPQDSAELAPRDSRETQAIPTILENGSPLAEDRVLLDNLVASAEPQGFDAFDVPPADTPPIARGDVGENQGKNQAPPVAAAAAPPKRTIWGFMRATSLREPAATAEQPAAPRRSSDPTQLESSATLVAEAQTPLPLVEAKSAPPPPERKASTTRQPSFFANLASGLRSQRVARSSSSEDPQDLEEVKVRLPRRNVDEDRIADLVIRCADARHVLRTEKAPEKLRDVGLRLEEGWREQLSEAQSLRSRLELTQDTVEDLEDENKNLRTQLGTLSEQIAAREDGMKELAKAHDSQREKDRSAWESEREQERRDNDFQVTELKRALAEERAVTAQLEVLLASYVRNKVPPNFAYTTAAAMAQLGSATPTASDFDIDDFQRSRRRDSRMEIGGQDAADLSITESIPSFPSLPSFEVENVDADGTTPDSSYGSGMGGGSSSDLLKRASPANGVEGGSEYELLFNLPPTPSSSRPGTTLFNEPMTLHQLKTLGLIKTEGQGGGHLSSSLKSPAATAGTLGSPISDFGIPSSRGLFSSPRLSPHQSAGFSPLLSSPDPSAGLGLVTPHIPWSDKLTQEAAAAATNLVGKSVLITGAASAVGSAVAVHVACRGACAITLVDESMEGMKATSEAMKAKAPTCKVALVQADLFGRRSEEQEEAEELIKRCLEGSEATTLDCIINASSSSRAEKVGPGHDDDGLENVMKDHTLGFLKTLRAELGLVKQSIHPPHPDDDDPCSSAYATTSLSIVNIVSSQVGGGSSGSIGDEGEVSKGSPLFSFDSLLRRATLNACQNSIAGMSRSVALEYSKKGRGGKGVRINTILLDLIESGQETSPVSEMACHLLSENACSINGASFRYSPSSQGQDGLGGLRFLCESPPLPNSPPRQSMTMTPSELEARLQATKLLADDELLKRTREENQLLRRREEEKERSNRVLTLEVEELRSRLKGTESALEGLFSSAS